MAFKIHCFLLPRRVLCKLAFPARGDPVSGFLPIDLLVDGTLDLCLHDIEWKAYQQQSDDDRLRKTRLENIDKIKIGR